MSVFRCIVIVVLCLFHFVGSAQKYEIGGVVIDSTNKTGIENAVVVVLRAKDSIIVLSERSQVNGSFKLSTLLDGQYILVVMHAGYADFVELFTISANTFMSFGRINMTLKEHLLKEVIVKNTFRSIRLKGDTTEFTADSFKVKLNATVEDLLKKLPGIQIDRYGQITAQGQQVKTILVDGEEFFSDDPTLVTRNLRAGIIEKIQVFNKKSDQAIFSGIDDGQRSKTINLKLKKSKENGSFGKISLGTGLKNYHNSQAMYNKFYGKEKFSVFAVVSNTGETSLNSSDKRKYGDGTYEYDPIFNTIFYAGTSDGVSNYEGRYNGEGYPLSQTAGLHYNNKWNNDKVSANANYQFQQYFVEGNNNIKTEYILPDKVYYNIQGKSYKSDIGRNKFSGIYELQIDSSTYLKATFNGSLEDRKNTSNFFTQNYGDAVSKLSQEERVFSSQGDQKYLNNTLLLRKALKKTGRTLSLNFKEGYLKTIGNEYIYSKNEYYISSGTLTQITDQFKDIKAQKNSVDANLLYTEPLTKKSSLSVNYGIAINSSSILKNSYNKALTPYYDQLDTIFSNDFTLHLLTQRGGVGYNLRIKKLQLLFSGNIGSITYKQQDNFSGSMLSRKFFNFFPQAVFSYTFSPEKSMQFIFSGNNKQPSIQQLQPLKNNEDPLNILIGNPQLNQAYQYNYLFVFNNYQSIKRKSIFINLNFHAITNDFGSKDSIETSGKRTFQPINVSGNYTYGGNISYNFHWNKPNLGVNLNLNFNGFRYSNLVNGNLNKTLSGVYVFAASFSREFNNSTILLDMLLSAGYNYSLPSLQKDLETKYWTYNLNPSLAADLPFHMEIHSDVNISLFPKASQFMTQTSIYIWNMWLGKQVFKNKSGIIKLSFFDLLNQNKGISRNISSNYYSENRYTTIARYALLSFTWNFNKQFKPKS